MTELDQLMPLEDIAKMFHVTKKTVYNWNSARTGPPRIRVAGKSFFRTKDVQAFIEAQTAR